MWFLTYWVNKYRELKRSVSSVEVLEISRSPEPPADSTVSVCTWGWIPQAYRFIRSNNACSFKMAGLVLIPITHKSGEFYHPHACWSTERRASPLGSMESLVTDWILLLSCTGSLQGLSNLSVVKELLELGTRETEYLSRRAIMHWGKGRCSGGGIKLDTEPWNRDVKELRGRNVLDSSCRQRNY